MAHLPINQEKIEDFHKQYGDTDAEEIVIKSYFNTRVSLLKSKWNISKQKSIKFFKTFNEVFTTELYEIKNLMLN